MEIDNNENIFVNLSHLLLKNIISFINDFEDIIRFTLVCKRWFQERNSYLVFLRDGVFVDTHKLKSYHPIIQLKHNEDLYLVSEAQTVNQITPKKLTCVDFLEFRRLIVKIDGFDISNVRDQLEKSKIKEIRLPYNVPRLSAGCLPENLENLTIDSYSYPLEEGDLPASLKVLSLYQYNHPLINGSLPPKLEKLLITVFSKTPCLQVNVFPTTLTSIENCPYQLIKFVKYLPCLESFECNSISIPDDFLEPGDFPDTLTSLSLRFYTSTLQPKVIPSSIKYLTLSCYIWDLTNNSIPNESHYKYICVSDISSDIQPNHLPPNIENLEILNYNKPLLPGSLPYGVTTLSLPKISPKHITEGVFPSSIKTLYLFTYEDSESNQSERRFNSKSIPNSVEALYLGHGYSEIDPTMLPDSIRTLKIKIRDLARHGIASFKPTITLLKIGTNSQIYRIDNNNFIINSNSKLFFVNVKEFEQISEMIKKYDIILDYGLDDIF
ncbi:hypothetical protein PPL_01289 [Heterostelium album PN500]|uniref:COI1 F-box domain-containing protein n=1 Tax=Heterostelium pallidum (strain ATCC 26659 / Pp 5 / PN500) TaxID=670386 RepID=D3AYM6_HETP5|nr:hypothetical protein PPL_01289 [Heterostelium album PN500]EFA86053.1 hypothetical protein PPL_01289 [Heterostelium album PN500]|eukprot:XP_020438159.1 hypothetical protein PPL_01289 [Heterostelium album PN500]